MAIFPFLAAPVAAPKSLPLLEEWAFDFEAGRLLSSGFVQVKVQNVNDAPVIRATSISSQEDEALVFDAARLASFLHDADGDQLSLSASSEVSGNAAISAAKPEERLAISEMATISSAETMTLVR